MGTHVPPSRACRAYADHRASRCRRTWRTAARCLWAKALRARHVIALDAVEMMLQVRDVVDDKPSKRAQSRRFNRCESNLVEVVSRARTRPFKSIDVRDNVRDVSIVSLPQTDELI